jgi:hypothetical protein
MPYIRNACNKDMQTDSVCGGIDKGISERRYATAAGQIGGCRKGISKKPQKGWDIVLARTDKRTERLIAYILRANT